MALKRVIGNIMKTSLYYKFSVLLIVCAGIMLSSCETGDDLSEPLPTQPPVSDWRFTIESQALIVDQTCYVLDYYEDDILIESEFYYIDGDTVILKGYQQPGEAIYIEDVSFSPVHPATGSSWVGEGENLIAVTDSLVITVPAGTFPAYLYEISDPDSGEVLGSLLLAEDIGIVSTVHLAGDDTIRSLVLNDYLVEGGEGAFPLEIGNEWHLVEGVYGIE